MLIAKKDFTFGGTAYKKGEPVTSLTGTPFHAWLYMPDNNAVENVSDAPKSAVIEPVAIAEIDKKNKNKEA